MWVETAPLTICESRSMPFYVSLNFGALNTKVGARRPRVPDRQTYARSVLRQTGIGRVGDPVDTEGPGACDRRCPAGG